MPRPHRVHYHGALYHVIQRGNHRQPIFLEDAHFRRYGHLVGESVERCGLRVHAYCWMPNHVHIAIQVADARLGVAMQRIAGGFSRYVQRSIPTNGQLYECRHRALLVDTDAYLLELVRYIHLNPVRAGLVSDPIEYRWSSHRAYLGDGPEPTPWLTVGPTLRLFDGHDGGARHAFHAFVLAGIGVEPPAVLRDGDDSSIEDLVRAGGRFIEERPRYADDGTLEGLIARVCDECGVAPWQLAAAGRYAAACEARRRITDEAVRRGLASLSELARRFNRATSTMSECARRR